MSLVKKEQRHDGVEIWTLARPEKRNALSPELLADLRARLHEVDEETSAVVIAGEGKVFCAGLDLSILANLTPEVIDEYCAAATAAYIDLYSCPAPTIAAVHGAALAGGFDISAMCDLRISTPDTKFGQLETRLGFSGLTEPLWRIVGLARAKESIFTAAIYDGREAYRIGFVNRIVEDPMAEALAVASQIAANGRTAVRAVKQMTGSWPAEEIKDSLRHQMERFKDFLMSPEAKARIAAYLASQKKSRS